MRSHFLQICDTAVHIQYRASKVVTVERSNLQQM